MVGGWWRGRGVLGMRHLSSVTNFFGIGDVTCPFDCVGRVKTKQPDVREKARHMRQH